MSAIDAIRKKLDDAHRDLIFKIVSAGGNPLDYEMLEPIEAVGADGGSVITFTMRRRVTPLATPKRHRFLADVNMDRLGAWTPMIVTWGIA